MVDQADKCCSYAGNTYKVTGYSNTMFASCAACDTLSGADWDGQLFNLNDDGCLWLPASPPDVEINGVLMGFVNLIRLTEIPELVDTGAGDALIGGSGRAPSPRCVFALSIKCVECAVNEHDMWVGHNPGPEPVGTYRYVRGCDTSQDTVALELVT